MGRCASSAIDQATIWLATLPVSARRPAAEPDFEEKDLRAGVEGDRLVTTHRSLEPDQRPVRVTGPDGKTEEVQLRAESGGRSVASLPIAEPGLYRITDGQRTALAAAGALNPLEMSDVRTTAEKLQPPA